MFDFQAMETTTEYAVSIFLEFILNDTKSINVSGKSFRIYSALRFEIMSFYINTHLEVASGSGSSVPVDPLALAAKLCSKLVSAPVKEIVHDEEDTGLVRIFLARLIMYFVI